MEGTAVARLSAVIFFLFFMVGIVRGKAQDSSSPAPAPISNGMAVDQGIAYILMFVALLLTYLLH
uniref:Uncharacterized protein n=1 Tax=Picea sitchensis TaxID=3332 RepID=A9NR89_PICSI|nr:unknown [Picea sitchensis]